MGGLLTVWVAGLLVGRMDGLLDGWVDGLCLVGWVVCV